MQLFYYFFSTWLSSRQASKAPAKKATKSSSGTAKKATSSEQVQNPLYMSKPKNLRVGGDIRVWNFIFLKLLADKIAWYQMLFFLGPTAYLGDNGLVDLTDQSTMIFSYWVIIALGLFTTCGALFSFVISSYMCIHCHPKLAGFTPSPWYKSKRYHALTLNNLLLCHISQLAEIYQDMWSGHDMLEYKDREKFYTRD